jgi:hypothetical protein
VARGDPAGSAVRGAAQAASFTRDIAGVAVRFSPYWEEGVRRFQQMVLDAVMEEA